MEGTPGYMTAHLYGVAAHRVNEITDIIAKKKAEGVEWTWEEGEAEFNRVYKIE
jgi:hypothetical protein